VSRAHTLVLLLLALGCVRVSPLSLPAGEGDAWTFGKETAPTAAPGDTIVFAALGDQGRTTPMQAAIAKSVREACADRCKFVLLMGDNLYEEGVASPEDAARLECIVDSYPTDFKYLVLGNHDYHILTPSLDRARAELEWIRSAQGRDAGARGGHHFYTFEVGPVRLVGLDTNYLVRGRIDETYREILDGIGRVRRRPDGWTVVFGHHPYLSNGPHGSAGSFRDAGLSLWHGRFFKYFMEQHVIGRADLYLAGHDHNMQFFPPVAGSNTAFAVAGSGARCTPRGGGRDEAPWFERYGHGFTLVEASPTRLTLRFFSFDGRPLWGAVTTHDGGWHSLEGFPRRSRSEEELCAAEQERVRSDGGCWQEL
jgi:hypothetical protein